MTLEIQRAACYSRVSGSMSAHLAQVKNRSGQRVARIRIYKGTLTQGWPVPPRAKKNKILTQPKIYETYDQRVVISVLCHCYVHELQTVGTPPDVARRILGDLHKFLHTHSCS